MASAAPHDRPRLGAGAGVGVGEDDWRARSPNGAPGRLRQDWDCLDGYRQRGSGKAARSSSESTRRIS